MKERSKLPPEEGGGDWQRIHPPHDAPADPSKDPGSGTLDRVYKREKPPPTTYVVNECKGGDATNSGGRNDPNKKGERYQQGTPEYLQLQADNMAKNGKTQAERDAGEELKRAIENGNVEYNEVKQPVDHSGNLGDTSVREYGDCPGSLE
ncbi:MAG: hypothetical protein R3B89_15005 [Polyangiaceae bacterium]